MIKNTPNMFNPRLNDVKKADEINVRLTRDARRNQKYANIPAGTDMSARPSATLVCPGDISAQRIPKTCDDPSCNDIITIYRLYREGRLNADIAAASIVNLIRVAFINGLDKKDDTFGIESLIYMDNILFSNVRYLIASIFTYGSSTEIINMIDSMIANTCTVIDYPLSESGRIQIGRMLDTIQQIIVPYFF